MRRKLDANCLLDPVGNVRICRNRVQLCTQNALAIWTTKSDSGKVSEIHGDWECLSLQSGNRFLALWAFSDHGCFFLGCVCFLGWGFTRTTFRITSSNLRPGKGSVGGSSGFIDIYLAFLGAEVTIDQRVSRFRLKHKLIRTQFYRPFPSYY